MSNKDRIFFIALGLCICALGIFIYHQLFGVKQVAEEMEPEEVEAIEPIKVSSLPEVPQAHVIKPVIESNVDYQKPVKINLSHMMRADVDSWTVYISDDNHQIRAGFE